MPIEELEKPEKVKDEFGQTVTLTHVFFGVVVNTNVVSAFSVRGRVNKAGSFLPYEPSRKQEFIQGDDLKELGADFTNSDARLMRRKIEGRKAAKANEQTAALERLAQFQKSRVL